MMPLLLPSVHMVKYSTCPMMPLLPPSVHMVKHSTCPMMPLLLSSVHMVKHSTCPMMLLLPPSVPMVKHSTCPMIPLIPPSVFEHTTWSAPSGPDGFVEIQAGVGARAKASVKVRTRAKPKAGQWAGWLRGKPDWPSHVPALTLSALPHLQAHPSAYPRLGSTSQGVTLPRSTSVGMRACSPFQAQGDIGG